MTASFDDRTLGPELLEQRVSDIIDGLIYFSNFLSEPEQQEVRQELSKLTFYQDTFRGKMLRRQYAQFGFRYSSTGRRLTPVEKFPDFLVRLANRVRAFSATPEALNQCIISHYDVGDGIGWHTDAWSFGENIIGISLGGPARFQFRKNGKMRHQFEVILSSGSVYCISGPARWNYQHRIVPVKTSRFAFTFRHVPGVETGTCPLGQNAD